MPTLSRKLQTALLDSIADEVMLVSAWGITALSIQGVTFASAITQHAVIALVLAELVYLGNWARSYRQTGDPTPPAVAARLDALEAHAAAAHTEPAPPQLVTAAGSPLAPSQPPAN